MRQQEFKGSKYTPGLSVTEIAARIRFDIKTATQNGTLPAGLKVSVRKDNNSIRVSVSAAPFFIQNPERIKLQYDAAGKFLRHLSPSEDHWTPFHSPEGKRLLETLEAIGTAYRRDNSDSMSDYFDCNFYLNVDQDYGDRERERRAILGLEPIEPEPKPAKKPAPKAPEHVGVMRVYKTWYWLHKEEAQAPRTPRSVDTTFTLFGPRGGYACAFHYASGNYSLNLGQRTYWPGAENVEIRRGQFAELPKAERRQVPSTPRLIAPPSDQKVIADPVAPVPDWMAEPVTQEETDFVNLFRKQ